MTTPVTKMHGARNDFVVLDARAHPRAVDATFARGICDRRSGVGADGLLILSPSSTAEVRMRILNADGSEAEMCGNGVRCAARYLREDGGDRVSIETLAGVIDAQILSRSPEFLVRVAIGRPVFEERALPGDAAFVSMGNPHVVFLRPSVEGFDLEGAALALSRDPQFPEGTNVHVAAVRGPRAMQAVHWERGAGMTQACGTGAAACAAVAIRSGLVASPVAVAVPGGTLTIGWEPGETAYLTGPAERVFDAEYCG